MPDFTYYSNFDPNASIKSVKYGSNALVLEVELNEAQNILDHKVKTLIKDRFGDGFYKTGSSLTYATGTVTLATDKAFADGNILTISSLALALAEGESAYLDVWEQELTFASTIKKYGNQQEANTITNYIQDSRAAEETTKRTQVQYTIVKTTGVAGHTYLPICTITGGILIDDRVSVGSTGSGGGGSIAKLYSSFTASASGTSVCTINQPDYVKASDVLDVYYQGAKLTPDVHYAVAANGLSITLIGFTITNGETLRYEVSKNMAVSTGAAALAIGYYENNLTIGAASAVVSVGIPQYNPANDLLIAHGNSVYLKKDVDFTVTGNGITAAINKVSGTWNTATEFDFIVIKNVVMNVSSVLQDQIDAMQLDLIAAESDIVTLQTDVGTLQTDVGTLQTDVGTLQTGLTAAETDISDLQLSVSSASTGSKLYIYNNIGGAF